MSCRSGRSLCAHAPLQLLGLVALRDFLDGRRLACFQACCQQSPGSGSRQNSAVSSQSSLTLTLRNSIRQPSASSPTYPLGASQPCHSLVKAPLTQRVTCLPLQVISYVFHSPAGLTLCCRSSFFRLNGL